jgi:ribosomal protein S10
MYICIFIKSKNKNSIKNFLLFFNKIIMLNDLHSKSIVHISKSKLNKEVFTVLKSPHVNKIAQEHFELNIYSRKIKIYSSKNFKFLVILKYLLNKYFFDINLKYSIIFNNKEKYLNKLLNFNNFYLMKHVKNEFYLVNYVKLFDLYGEILFKKI